MTAALSLDDEVLHIGHDIDGPYYDFVGAFVADLAEQHPDRAELYRLENCHPNRDFFNGLGMDFDAFMAAYADAMGRGIFTKPGFTHPGSVEAVQRLDKELGDRAKHVLITDRSVGPRHAGAHQTAAWAAAVAFPFTTIRIARDKTVIPTHFFIEDHVDNYRALRAAGSECFLVRRFWNADTPDIPTDHWVESADEYIDRILERVQHG